MNKLLLLVTFSIFSICFAADGSSGCGPGWYLFQENTLVSSSLRATTNGFLFPTTTFGMTTRTSNCTQHRLVLKEKESLYFAAQNYFELKGEIAKGNGEYLVAFAQTIGCRGNFQSRFNDKMKHNYNDLYSVESVNPEKLLMEVYKVILLDEQLVKSCSLES